jgi:hypothetical protein
MDLIKVDRLLEQFDIQFTEENESGARRAVNEEEAVSPTCCSATAN